MDKDPSRIESRLDELAERLQRVEARLAAVERHAASVSDATEASLPGAPATKPFATAQPAGEAWLPLFGRILLILAGAFLLRAITDAGVLPPVAVAAAGLVYAVVWFVMADIVGGKERRRSATLYGIAASMIAFPLIWEATVKFRFIGPVASAVALAFITALGLVVVFRKRLEGLAWVCALGGAATALALAAGTKMWVLFVAGVLLLGLATLWLGYDRGWRALGWVTAAVVDAAVLLLTAMVLFGNAQRVAEILSPGPLVLLQLTLVVVYCGSFVLHTLLRDEDICVAEIVQAAFVLLIGLVGAIEVTRSTGISGIPLGAVSLALAAGSYATSFMLIDRRSGSRVTFIFYTALALVFTLAGLVTLMRGVTLAVALCVAAVLTAWLGSSRRRATLSVHASVYAIAAAAASGMFATAFDVFTRPRAADLEWNNATVFLVLLAVAACCWFPVATHGRTWGRFSGIPRLLMLVVLVSGIGAIVVSVGSRWLARGTDPTREFAVLAAFRTGVLAAEAVLLAGIGRWRRVTEATWLAYLLLVAGGLKLLFEDVRAGHPMTLFVSFALYGGALIVASRLARQTER